MTGGFLASVAATAVALIIVDLAVFVARRILSRVAYRAVKAWRKWNAVVIPETQAVVRPRDAAKTVRAAKWRSGNGGTP